MTGCVAASVRRRARPVPLRAALAQQQQTISVAIVYEQWGWPLPTDAEEAVSSRFAGIPILVDRVDSADFFMAARGYGAFEIVSLSKVIGLDAGGIARDQRGNYVAFGQTADGRAPARLRSHPAVRELYKQSDQVHPAVADWLEHNCMVAAAEAERVARSTAAMTVLNSELAAGWPSWMPAALEHGAGPVWAPILRGTPPRVQWRALAMLAREWGLLASIRTFNWTGNPVSPCYEAAVALPIHSGVTDLGAGTIVSALEREVVAASRSLAAD